MKILLAISTVGSLIVFLLLTSTEPHNLPWTILGIAVYFGLLWTISPIFNKRKIVLIVLYLLPWLAFLILSLGFIEHFSGGGWIN